MSNVLITGANQGIGYYFVKKMLLEGHCVAVLDIETNQLEMLKKAYPKQLFYECVDVRNFEKMQKAVEKMVGVFKYIDIAIHNACLCTFEMEKNISFETYQDVLDINYFGALRLTKCVIPYMQARKKGKIIYTSSGVGVTGFIGISPYASSKGAIEALAKCLNIEYANDNISFHIMHPPLTYTKSSSSLPVPKEMMADPQKVGEGLAKNIDSSRFIICHSLSQKIQVMLCYLMPLKMGKFLSKMSQKYKDIGQ